MKLSAMSFVFFLGMVNAKAAILIEEGNKPLKSPHAEKITKSGETSTVLESDSSEVSHRSFAELKSRRRVAAGGQIAGGSGLIGTQIELNFTPYNAFTVGFGGSSGFQSFQFLWKRTLSGTVFVPYLSLGLAHWMSQGDGQPLRKTSPAYLEGQLLNEEQKATGKFTKEFLIPAFGLQYFQLFGSAVGSSVYAEVDLMTDLTRGLVVPTGSLGFLYYF